MNFSENQLSQAPLRYLLKENNLKIKDKNYFVLLKPFI
jgi:hypothetical protein